MPEDIKDLSPAQQQKIILRRAFSKMAGGIALLLIFCDPMCDCLSVLGESIGVNVFYVSFAIAPFATNASELIAAYNFAQAKTARTAEVALSGLLGAGVMNNTFGLFIFLYTLWSKTLFWDYAAETMCIILVELIVIAMARKPTNTMLDAAIITALYPGAILIVWVFEELLEWS